MEFPNTIRVSLRPASVGPTIENFKGIEWYSIVLNAISKYHSGIIETGKCRPTIEDFSDIGWYYI